MDSTPNKIGQIIEYVQAYIEVGLHKMTQHLFVTNIENKKIMIGYLYLYKYNPNIDWQKNQWKFTRCLDICASKVYKIWDIKVGANKLYLEIDISGFLLLNNIRDKDSDNHILSWIDITDLGSHQQAIIIATILNNWD